MSDSIKLHMGFINTPYTKKTIMRPITSAKEESKRKHRRGFTKTMTAQDVANILEEKYGIVDTFSMIYEEDINDIIKDGFIEVAEDMLSNKNGQTSKSIKNLMKPYTNQIVTMFRQFLDNEEMNGMVEGVPTEVAIGGRKRWRGRIRKSKAQRPSFENTGIYRASFRVWADTK